MEAEVSYCKMVYGLLELVMGNRKLAAKFGIWSLPVYPVVGVSDNHNEELDWLLMRDIL